MYFHNGNNKGTTIFNKNECNFEEIYVSGLKEGFYLKSDYPYFFSATNGHLSISTQTKTLGYFDSNNILIETIDLTFITECTITEDILSQKGSIEDLPARDSWLLISILILLLVWILINQRRKEHVKNRLDR